MPGMETRRIGEIGSGQSRYLILPRAWCDGSLVRPGTEVQLLYDGVLVVVPPSRKAAGARILRLMGAGSL